MVSHQQENDMDLETYLIENTIPEDDVLTPRSREPGSTRRAKLTFKHINRLRKVRELKKLEMAAQKKFVQRMYGPAPQPGDLGGGLGF